MFTLENKVALVTGATGGIGHSIAQALHRAGATVVISGTRAEKLQEVADALGERALPVVANLSDPDSVQHLVQRTEEACGQLDILVCNAGITRDTLTLRMKDED